LSELTSYGASLNYHELVSRLRDKAVKQCSRQIAAAKVDRAGRDQRIVVGALGCTADLDINIRRRSKRNGAIRA
jgi:hypothetical protein